MLANLPIFADLICLSWSECKQTILSCDNRSCISQTKSKGELANRERESLSIRERLKKIPDKIAVICERLRRREWWHASSSRLPGAVCQLSPPINIFLKIRVEEFALAVWVTLTYSSSFEQANCDTQNECVSPRQIRFIQVCSAYMMLVCWMARGMMREQCGIADGKMNESENDFKNEISLLAKYKLCLNFFFCFLIASAL